MLGLLTHPMPDTTPATIGCLTDSPPRARIASWASHTSTWPMYVECFYPPDDYPVEPLKHFVAVKVRTPETVLARRRVPLRSHPSVLKTRTLALVRPARSRRSALRLRGWCPWSRRSGVPFCKKLAERGVGAASRVRRLACSWDTLDNGTDAIPEAGATQNAVCAFLHRLADKRRYGETFVGGSGVQALLEDRLKTHALRTRAYLP